LPKALAGLMTGYFAPPGNARSGVNIPRIWITIALSIVLHALVLWQVKPDLFKPSNDPELKGDARGPLSVQIAPRPRPPAPLAQRPSPPTPPSPARRPVLREAPQPRAAPRPPPPPPVIARRSPAPEIPARPQVERPVPAPQTAPAQAPREGDLASYVESRRRARTEPSPATPPSESTPAVPPTEDPNERANRIAAANLGTNRAPTFGAPRRGGGVFTIRHMAYDYAEFLFYGWNKDIRRNTGQVIEVRKGNNPDIRIAVVRRMIAIIRDYEQNDFVWESPRLGRNVTLSARQRDNAGLEAFLMREFFEDDRRP
jgi:outer membrane biosynthesis protein TonB